MRTPTTRPGTLDVVMCLRLWSEKSCFRREAADIRLDENDARAAILGRWQFVTEKHSEKMSLRKVDARRISWKHAAAPLTFGARLYVQKFTRRTHSTFGQDPSRQLNQQQLSALYYDAATPGPPDAAQALLAVAAMHVETRAELLPLSRIRAA